MGEDAGDEEEDSAGGRDTRMGMGSGSGSGVGCWKWHGAGKEYCTGSVGRADGSEGFGGGRGMWMDGLIGRKAVGRLVGGGIVSVCFGRVGWMIG